MTLFYQNFLATLTWWTTLMYFNTCDGGGMIILRPILYDFTPRGVEPAPSISAYTMYINATDKQSVSVGEADFDIYFYALKRYSFPGNTSLVYNFATPFHSIERKIELTVRMQKHPANLMQDAFFNTSFDLIRKGKDFNITLIEAGYSGAYARKFYVRVRLICDPFSSGPLCERCRPGVPHERFICREGGVMECKRGYTHPEKACSVFKDWCSPLPCLHGTKCINKPSAFDYSCICAPSYKGKNCSEDVNECETNPPCKNGGKCTNTFGSYECDCPPIYQGKNCTKCANPSPCENEGVCSVGDSGYKCQCRSGYYGKNCTNCIEPSPCKNGGTCSVDSGGYTCHCPPQYQGKNCTKDVNECYKFPCQHGGTCQNIFGSYKCECGKKYKGKNCSHERHTNLCKEFLNPCQNGGTCSDLVDDFKCNCRKGYQGENCAVDVNECLSVPCANDGRCINVIGSYKCYCAGRFTGDRCNETKKEYCYIDSHCSNGGKCVATRSGSKCICRPGFEGMTCDKDVNECTKYEPCLNNGKCHNTVGSFRCKCPPSFLGDQCQYIRLRNCMLDKCLHNGTCAMVDEKLYCKCKPFFYGPYCEDKYTECVYGMKFCKNNGTCYLGAASTVACDCPPNFTGESCQHGWLTDRINIEKAKTSKMSALSIGLLIMFLLLLLLLAIFLYVWWRYKNSAEDEGFRALLGLGGKIVS